MVVREFNIISLACHIIYAQTVRKFLSHPVCSPRSSSTGSCISFLPLLHEIWPQMWIVSGDVHEPGELDTSCSSTQY